jgi:hypothetical protein
MWVIIFMRAGRLNDWIKAKGFVTMTDVEWRLDSRLLTMARSLSRRLSHRAAVSHYGSCSCWGINCRRVIVRLAAEFIERPRPGFEVNLPYPLAMQILIPVQIWMQLSSLSIVSKVIDLEECMRVEESMHWRSLLRQFYLHPTANTSFIHSQ